MDPEQRRYRKGLPPPDISRELGRMLGTFPWTSSNVIPMKADERLRRDTALRDFAALDVVVTRAEMQRIVDLVNVFAQSHDEDACARLISTITDEILHDNHNSRPMRAVIEHVISMHMPF